ncbi:biotin-lipoyl like family protein [Lyngbya aestuarii BL J]|uniref:Biotin-lipoyl like family protein n=1 Tax=Lyngbya aestuarii BL J TaxID=1348334 RepID=U7QNP9_9CYAN|nr:HlyD family efflux transporter periplasmic adaptor subunit [Lyngbya aestuarii]ERT09609.1 biotin-lipoyl like family protein [Lyngbya aestuarii BL J]
MASNFQPIELEPLDSDDFLPPIGRWTQWAGLLLLGTFGGSVVLAGFIRYTPSVRVPVVAQPEGDVELVSAATSGIVERIVVRENQPLEQGEVIAYVNQSLLLTQKRNLQAQLTQLKQELDQLDQYVTTLDLQILTTLESKTSRRSRQKLDDLSVELAVVELTKSTPEVAQEFAQERRTLLKQRWQVQKEFVQSQSQLEQITSLIGHSTIRAPQAGTIIQLNLPKPGQVVESDTIIAQIVPTQVPLVFLAWVAEKDISRIEIDQQVHLQIAVYPFQEYGILKGRVKRISLNGNAPQASARQTSKAYYEVLIQPESSYLVKDDHQYSIYSGMEGTADILVTQERLLGWVLKKAKLVSNF